jgi:hypothetical protein
MPKYAVRRHLARAKAAKHQRLGLEQDSVSHFKKTLYEQEKLMWMRNSMRQRRKTLLLGM